MAATRIIEQESGTYTGRVHPHNGYYAGDFSSRRHDARNRATRVLARGTFGSTPEGETSSGNP